MTGQGREPPTAPQRRADYVLLLILGAGFILRLYLGSVTTYVWDEERDYLVTVGQISFEPGNVHLPLRGTRHPILPHYLIYVSGELFGNNSLGYRMLNILAGVLTGFVVYCLARESFGLAAGRFAAALLMFNEYHIGVSALATDISFYLLFAALAMRSLCKFLITQRGVSLYLAGVYAGLAFMCKEIACLLVVAYALYFVLSKQRRWLLRKEPYLGALLFLLVITPDMLAGIAGAGSQVNWSDHLSRVSSLGFNRHYLLFFGRDAVRLVYDLLGREFWDTAGEYGAMNVAFGALLLGGIALTTWRLKRQGEVARFLLLLFWFTLGFFMIIQPGRTRSDLDPVVWLWVDVTMLPAVVLTGNLLAELSCSRPVVAGVALTAAVAWSASAVYPGHLGAKAYGVGVSPEFLVPADGKMVEVRVHFHSAVLRDPNPEAELIGVWVRTPSGVLLHGAESSDVELPSPGMDHRALRLRAVEGQNYGLFFRLRDSCGRSLDLGKTVYVPTASTPSRRRKFWVPAGPGDFDFHAGQTQQKAAQPTAADRPTRTNGHS